MKAAGPSSILFLLLASAAGAQDPESKTDRDPWNGFGVGSWVIELETASADGKMTTQREKQTRTESDRPGIIQLTVHEEGTKPGVFDGKKSIRWHIPGYDPALDPTAEPTSTTRQDLTIQGTNYACEVKRYELGRTGEKVVITLWHCKGANIPYREAGFEPRTLAMRPDVLRLDVDYAGKDRSAKTSIRVVNLREERQIGPQKVVCVREEWETEMTEGDKKGKTKTIVLLSNDVPGREVEVTGEGEIGGTRLKRHKRIEAFHVVREK